MSKYANTITGTQKRHNAHMRCEKQGICSWFSM